MVCTEAAWSEGVSAAGVREVLKAEGETEALRCGKRFREYAKQQGGWCGQKTVSQSESRGAECGQVLQGLADQGKVLGLYSRGRGEQLEGMSLSRECRDLVD